jgi:drug/metabolite transporter (DMT)-like permease
MAGALLVLGLDAWQAFELGLGTFLGLLAGMFYGGYFLVMQRSRQQLDATTSFWWAGSSAVVVLLLASLLLRQPLWGYSLLTWLCFLGLGLIVQAFGQFSFSFALGYLPASLVAPAGLAQPVLTAVLAAFLLNQSLTQGEIIGGLTVLAGIFIVQRSRLISQSGR